MSLESTRAPAAASRNFECKHYDVHLRAKGFGSNWRLQKAEDCSDPTFCVVGRVSSPWNLLPRSEP